MLHTTLHDGDMGFWPFVASCHAHVMQLAALGGPGSRLPAGATCALARHH